MKICSVRGCKKRATTAARTKKRTMYYCAHHWSLKKPSQFLGIAKL